jgi:alpha/beta superfamily hydrolase
MPPRDSDDALVVEAVRLPVGGCGLQAELAYAGEAPPLGGVVLAGPHPLLGGALYNNVVRALGDGLAERGVPTLRFDYRGAGRAPAPAVNLSDQFAQFQQTAYVPEEGRFRDDLAAAAAFLRATLGEAAPLALVGYSFGCSLLPHAGLDDSAPLALIAPTVGVHCYDAFTAAPNPLLVVVSRDDSAVDAAQLRRWFDALTGPKQLIRERLDDHFFRGYEAWLVETVFAFLLDQWR